MKVGRPFSQGRNGKSSPWAFMERFEIPAFDEPDVNYLTRWRIVQTPWCALYLHRMERPDSRPTLHDHPWSFVSIILRGGYTEERLNLQDRLPRRRIIRRVNVMRRDDAHYIAELHRPKVWSLLLVGKRRRTWGYWEPSTWAFGEWIWTEFDKHEHAAEFEKAMAARRAS